MLWLLRRSSMKKIRINFHMWCALKSCTLTKGWIKRYQNQPLTSTLWFMLKIKTESDFQFCFKKCVRKKYFLQKNLNWLLSNHEVWELSWEWRSVMLWVLQLNLKLLKRKVLESWKKDSMIFMRQFCKENCMLDQELLEFGPMMLQWVSAWRIVCFWLTITLILSTSGTCLLFGFNMASTMEEEVTQLV